MGNNTGLMKVVSWLLAGLAACMLHLRVAAAEPFSVVVSIKPVHSIVAGLMEGIEQPALLVAEGTPYDHQLTAQQRTLLKQADLLIWVGPELEGFLQQGVKEVGEQTRVLELLNNSRIKVLPARHDDNRRDPFFWLDSRNAIILLDELTSALIEADPSRSHVYSRNRKKVLRKLAKLDRELEYGYRGLKGQAAYLYYDTLQYFEQAYAMKVVGTLLDSPGEVPSAAAVVEARAILTEGAYGCLLTERGLSNDSLPLLIGKASVRVGELDSFATRLQPGPELYAQLISHNTEVIKNCLKLETVGRSTESDVDSALAEISTVGGRFMLRNHNGDLVTEKDLLGKYQLIYFGYTSCPDICPISLQVVSAALKKLGDRAKLIQPYFISVDPERDDVETIYQYVNYFDFGLIGLTGTPSMIEKVARQYRVIYEKVIDDPSQPDMYQMDHTASVFLMAPDGRFIAKLAHGISPTKMAERIAEFLPDE